MFIDKPLDSTLARVLSDSRTFLLSGQSRMIMRLFSWFMYLLFCCH